MLKVKAVTKYFPMDRLGEFAGPTLTHADSRGISQREKQEEEAVGQKRTTRKQDFWLMC